MKLMLAATAIGYAILVLFSGVLDAREARASVAHQVDTGR